MKQVDNFLLTDPDPKHLAVLCFNQIPLNDIGQLASQKHLICKLISPSVIYVQLSNIFITLTAECAKMYFEQNSNYQ